MVSNRPLNYENHRAFLKDCTQQGYLGAPRPGGPTQDSDIQRTRLALAFLGHPASSYKMSEVNNKERTHQSQTQLTVRLAFVKIVRLQRQQLACPSRLSSTTLQSYMPWFHHFSLYPAPLASVELSPVRQSLNSLR